MLWRDCNICQVPIASETCPHVLLMDGRSIMSTKSHEQLGNEINRLQRALLEKGCTEDEILAMVGRRK